MSISLTPDQIRDLARQIEELMRNLRNIDAILAATRDDLRRARRLKLRADDAKYERLDILSVILMHHKVGLGAFKSTIFLEKN